MGYVVDPSHPQGWFYVDDSAVRPSPVPRGTAAPVIQVVDLMPPEDEHAHGVIPDDGRHGGTL